jgi:hypothetical protein
MHDHSEQVTYVIAYVIFEVDLVEHDTQKTPSLHAVDVKK